jgi:hypothetical protein
MASESDSIADDRLGAIQSAASSMTGNPFSSDPEGERPGQTGALPRTGATHANARPMTEQDRPIWKLDFSLQDLNVSASGH